MIVQYGYAHYCEQHDTLVDYDHINTCDCIKPTTGKVTDIILPLKEVKSIRDHDTDILKILHRNLKELTTKITRLTQTNPFVSI